MTTRGMKEDEMRSIAKLIAKVFDNIKDEKVIEDVRKEVIELGDMVAVVSSSGIGLSGSGSPAVYIPPLPR